MDPATPGVRVPPPLIYLTTIVMGVAIDRAVPVRLLSSFVAGWLGGALVLVGLTISGLSIREFRKARTTIRPDRAASALVTTGPFRYSRNPMYIATSARGSVRHTGTTRPECRVGSSAEGRRFVSPARLRCPAQPAGLPLTGLYRRSRSGSLTGGGTCIFRLTG